MKSNLLKTAVMAMVAAFIFVAIPQNAFAQSKQDKQLQKESDKMYKKKLNEFKSEGWKLAGDSRTLEVALLEHYKKTADEQNKVIVGEVTQCKSMNVCRQAAVTYAQNRYASLASGHVKGRVETMERQNDNETEEEISKMIGAYEKMVQAEIGGLLTESYSMVKDNGNGTKWFQTYFIVNEEKAHLARKKAMERSLQETKMSIKEAEEISKFVQEGFSLE